MKISRLESERRNKLFQDHVFVLLLSSEPVKLELKELTEYHGVSHSAYVPLMKAGKIERVKRGFYRSTK